MRKDIVFIEVFFFISIYFVFEIIWKFLIFSNVKWLEMKEEFMSCGSRNIFLYM